LGLGELEKMDKIVLGIKNAIKKDDQDRWYNYAFSIVINLILLYIVNNLIYWNLSFISTTFSDVLWALNLTLVVTIIANVMFILYHKSWFKHATKIIVNITALIAAYTVLIVFPFIINQTFIALGLKILFILAVIAAFVAIIVEIIRLVLTDS
jgi:hypothetical protein